MSRGTWFEGDRGVSEVVGVVLLIGVTALLVGGVGVYLFQYGDGLPEAGPSFSSSTVYNDSTAGDGQTLRITHESGDPVPTEEVSLRIQDATTESGTPLEYRGNALERQVGEAFTASETLVLDRTAFTTRSGSPVTGSQHLDLGEAAVRIVWTTENGKRSEIIYEWTGPDRTGA
ncbi:type IV pilin [Halorientalis pallida]|uniref:type IV pilin n=1 Tax=Halorientalis pallida TaxID=2479928 RepID=UPI003C6F785B